jgi:hypothetical protein
MYGIGKAANEGFIQISHRRAKIHARAIARRVPLWENRVMSASAPSHQPPTANPASLAPPRLNSDQAEHTGLLPRIGWRCRGRARTAAR